MHHLKMLSILAVVTFSWNYATAQHEEHLSHKKNKGIIELITSGVYAYELEHQEGIPGTEIHLTYWFNHTYGTGFSYTAKFPEEEVLHDIAILGSWIPKPWVTLNMGPNFSIGTEHRSFALSAYFESEINIRPSKWFHFGPLVGTLVGNNTELTTGFHLGFEFY